MIGIVGLTGGIASGKTTVANLFQSLGVPILDADVISRELVVPQMPAWKKIIEYFGKEILNPDQTLNRNILRKIVFENKESKEKLEQILHPLIYKTMLERAKKFELKEKYCLFVVPLLIETNQTHIVQRLLVVDCEENEQKQRVGNRDQLNKIEIERILAAQCSRQTRLAQADDVIHNNAQENGLMPQVIALHQLYLKLFYYPALEKDS
jgi:dephospho-CoA kinase